MTTIKLPVRYIDGCYDYDGRWLEGLFVDADDNPVGDKDIAAALNATANAPMPKYALGYGDSNPDYLDGIEGVALDPFNDNDNIWPRLFVATTEEDDPRIERVLALLNATASVPDLTALEQAVAQYRDVEAKKGKEPLAPNAQVYALIAIANAALALFPKDGTP